MNYDIAEIKYKLKKYGQEHLLNFYDTLDENKKEELCANWTNEFYRQK